MYVSKLDFVETQEAIQYLNQLFSKLLSEKLNLLLVTSPLFVPLESGLQDDLNGVERMVTFSVKSGTRNVINQSLAKWKRMALGKYDMKRYKGLYTNMHAIRPDEQPSPLHSLYVDQYDWEMIISEAERNEQFLQSVVRKIVEALKETEDLLVKKYPVLSKKLSNKVTFITTQELADRYPNCPPSEREYLIVKEHGCVFLSGIGKLLRCNTVHDGRAPDYDDWELNGDILVYDAQGDRCIELSSMGIRVDSTSLETQLKQSGHESRKQFEFHQKVLRDEHPLTIGGGIGKSRVALYLLEKRHIGEVQVSFWPDDIIKDCAKKNIILL